MLEILRVERLSKTFGQRAIFREVSFSMHRGETMAVTGESGTGKSVLAECIAGILRPDSGEVHFHGSRGQMQILLQDSDASLNPRMRIGAILEEPLRILGRAMSAHHAMGLLDLVHLPRSIQQRHPHELSGGQRQRVAIARALAPDPILLIADEPAASLDPSLQAEIFKIFEELGKTRGLSLLLISHHEHVVQLLASRKFQMQNGK